MTRKKKKGPSKKSPKPASKQLDTRKVYLVLFCIGALLILISRILFLPIPLDRDEGAYGYLGWMALSGATPYVDFYEMKPPLLFYSYAVIVAFFGKLPVGLHLATLVIHGFEAFIIYRIGRRIWNATGGYVAALVFVILGMNAQAVGFAMQSEHVVLAYALPGLLLTISGMQDRRLRQLFWGGCLLACSALVKQSAIFYCLAGVVIVGLYLVPVKHWTWNALRKTAGTFILGALAPILFFFLLLMVFGALDEFWYWFYEHPTRYVSQRTVSEGMDQFRFFGSRVAEGHWYWIMMAGLGLVVLPFVRDMNWRYKVFLPILTVLGFLTIVPGFRFYGHYWQLFFPALCLLAPGVIVLAEKRLGAIKGKRWLKLLPALVLIAGLAWQFGSLWHYYYQSDLDMVMKRAYLDNYFPEHKVLSDFLNGEMKEGDDLIVMGSEPQVYLYTGKKAPSRHFYMTYTSKDIPEAHQWEDETINAISGSKPDYIVFMYEPYSWMFKDNSRRKLYNWTHNLARTRYTTIAHIDLIRGMHMNPLITGSAAASHTPRSNHYITIYKRNAQ